jgi:hypothetical protein
VWFDRTAGTFYEKIRSNLDPQWWDGKAQYGNARNQALTLTAAAYMGQRMQPRSNGNSIQMQPATARVSFQQQDSNFSISSIGSRSLFGNGTAEQPFVTQNPYSTERNVRSVVFRANGSGVVCISANSSAAEAEALWFGGTTSSFTGGGVRSRDSYYSGNAYGLFPTPTFHFVWVNDGEIFSLAGNAFDYDSGEYYVQERGTGYSPIAAWAAPNTSQTGLWLMNYGQSYNSFAPRDTNWGGHYLASSPTLWQGLGTSASPLNMPTWSKSVPQWGHAQNLYASRDGTVTFNFETQSPVCWDDDCTWHAPSVERTVRPGLPPVSNLILGTTNFAHTNGAGSGTFSVKAFTGINFNGPNNKSIAFRITNLVFTPS